MSDERTERESAIRRIKALLETAGRTEAEIDACSAKVQELLVKYHLSMTDLGEDKTIIHENDFLTDSSDWIKSLMTGVARLYLCGHYYETFPADWVEKHGLHYESHRLIAGSHRVAYLRHNFIGKQVDVTVAKAMGQYFVKAIQALCEEEALKWPGRERRSFRVAFMNSCVARLRYRMFEKRKQAEKGIVGNTNLPAVRSMYQQAQDAANDFMEQMGIEVKQKKTSLANITHQGGARAGWKAGDEIGLETQVGDAANNGNRRLK